MRSDLLSKRLFAAGCFGLPWLWCVHVLYWRGNKEGEASQGLLNPDDHFPDAPTVASPEEIRNEAEKWVRRCKIGAVSAVSVWIGWIILSQLLRGVFPTWLYMLPDDDPSLTGW